MRPGWSSGYTSWIKLSVIAVLIISSALAAHLLQLNSAYRKNTHIRESELISDTVSSETAVYLNRDALDTDYPMLMDVFSTLRNASSTYRGIRLYVRHENGNVSSPIRCENIDTSEAPAIQTPLAEVFSSGKPLTIGPYSNRGETFLTVLVPVYQEQGKTSDVVLSIVYDASLWRRDLFIAALPALVFALISVSVLLSGLLFLSRSPYRRRTMVIMTLLLGFSITLYISWTLHLNEHRGRVKAFTQLAVSSTFIPKEALDDIQDYELEGLGRFFEGSEYVDFNEFAHYTGFLAKNPYVQSWMGIAAVPHENFHSFIDQELKMNHVRISIWELDEQGRNIPAERRETYFPLVRIAPLQEHLQQLGFDHGSVDQLYEALMKAQRTGRIISAEPAIKDDDAVLAVYRPIFSGNSSRELRGFTAAFVDPRFLVSPDNPLPLEFSLLRKDGSRRILASSNPFSGDQQFSMTRHVLAFGNVFALTAFSDPVFLPNHPVREGLVASLAGIALSIAAAVIMHMVLHRKEELEQLVDERTSMLQESREHLSAAMRSIGDGVITCSTDGWVTSLNTAAESLTGWSTEEAQGKSIEEVFCIINALDRKTAENPAARCIREGIVVGLANHTVLVSRNGKEYQIADSCAPIYDTTGTVFGAVLVFRDVTEAYLQQQRLEEQRKRLDYILEVTGTSIDIIDSTYSIRYINGNQRKNYGEPKGKKCYEYFYHRDKPCENCGCTQALQSRQRVITERVLPQEGNRIVEIHSIPFTDSDGSLAVAEFKVDITRRKQAEARQKKLQEQLMQSQKLESVGRLAGGVAHDFNNMLSVILGYAEMVLQQIPPGEKYHHEIQEVHRAAQRSAALTSQLLSFARQQAVDPKILNLDETVGNMVNMLQRLIGENIKLVWKPDCGELIKIDPVQLDQVLLNLCINAGESISDTGTVVIETSKVNFDSEYCRVHDGILPGSYAKVSVSDTGSGMDKETMRKIFEPFFTTKSLGKGTGLGLATVFGIIKQNRGLIHPYSEPGEGTTFNIYLPLAGTEGQSGSHPEAQTVLGRRLTVLVTDDSPMVQELNTRMLGQLGHTVLSAVSPSEALQLGNTHRKEIDLLLTDIMMPEMKGTELYRALKAFIPGLRCIFASGYTAEKVLPGSSQGEQTAFLQKPFSKKQLHEAISKVMGS